MVAGGPTLGATALPPATRPAATLTVRSIEQGTLGATDRCTTVGASTSRQVASTVGAASLVTVRLGFTADRATGAVAVAVVIVTCFAHTYC